MSSPVPSAPSASAPSIGTVRAGLGQAVGAYGLWGVLPVYFLLVAPTGPFEIVGERILFSLLFCAVLLTATRGWRRIGDIVRQPRLFLTVGLAGAVIYVNWQVYVLAVVSGHVLEGALGYFINPIVTVLLAVLVQRERLRPLQWTAVGISAVAVVVLAVGYGRFPWISLALAFSFGLYGLIKKRIGSRVGAVSGLSLETAWLAPVAILQLVLVAGTGGIAFGTIGPLHTALVVSSGVLTAVPLLLFAGAARRLSLTALGLVQYLAPILQFLFGAFVLGEDLPPERWAGFALVWVALLVLTVDLLRAGRRSRSGALEEPAPQPR